MQLDAEQMSEIVMMAIETATAPLLARLAVLEANTDARLQAKDGAPGQKGDSGETGPVGPPGPKGEPGEPVDLSTIEALQAELKLVRDELLQIKSLPPQPTAADIEALIAVKASAAVNLIEPRHGKDGQSVTIDDVLPVITAEVSKAVAALPPAKDGEPGKSIDPVEVELMVLKAVEAIPKPKDGTSVTVEDVTPIVEATVAKAVAGIPPAKEAVGLASALIGRDGRLVLTFSDGATKDVGVVVGRDCDPEELRRAVVDEVAKIPKPKDGEPGPPGRDGTLENLKMTFDGERNVAFAFKDGTPVEGGAMTFPTVIHRGVYEEGRTYEQSDAVTWGGSTWIAKERTSAKPDMPDTASRAWVLAVKRGAEGKRGLQGSEGRVGAKGEKGDPGPERW